MLATYHSPLKKELKTFDLTMLGIGAIIGTGIFVLTGTGALTAGPGLMISFVLAAIACLFASLCYAEFAAMVPESGSAYTYAYTTLGEIVAFIIGWDLMLEYLSLSQPFQRAGQATFNHSWRASASNCPLLCRQLQVPSLV